MFFRPLFLKFLCKTFTRNPEVSKFVLDAQFSFTEYFSNLFRFMAKKDNDGNFQSSSMKPSETMWFQLIHSNLKHQFQNFEHSQLKEGLKE